ncbi:hypothetical protein [Paractinoplanes rishiriensis]|uniref:Uncharacterized protein n=1 Tax=Paractinoplanes rishiriensis TaxID=1050105 RepID=A0A919JTW6_9ACTN|nr:hypothetical protein [Actinoplanes rishiriensis]GIE93317.1 hypothetical protein Ari01nite_07820 [Actinoplanes rishiriensis]
MTTTSPSNTNPPTVTVWHVYFIGFQFNAGVGMGFSNTELPLSFPIEAMDDIRFVEQHLSSKGYSRPVVMGFALLRQEPAPAPREHKL